MEFWLSGPLTSEKRNIWRPCPSELGLLAYDFNPRPFFAPYHGTRTDISYLPSELLRKIFNLLIGPYLGHGAPPGSSRSIHHTLLTTLRLVCRLWRDIAYDTSLLWTRIDLAYPTFATTCLSRCNSYHPIHLFGMNMEFPMHSLSSPTQIWVPGLRARCDLITTIRVQALTPTTLPACTLLFQYLTAPLFTFKKLTDLTLVNSQKAKYPVDLGRLAFVSLKRLYLEGVDLRFTAPLDGRHSTFPSLEELDFIASRPRARYIVTVLEVLCGAPRLQSLRIHFNSAEYSVSERILAVLRDSEPIQLFRLVDLLFSNVPGNFANTMQCILDAPRLGSCGFFYRKPALLFGLLEQRAYICPALQAFRSCQCDLGLVHQEFPPPSSCFLKLGPISAGGSLTSNDCHCSTFITGLGELPSGGLLPLQLYMQGLVGPSLPVLMNDRITHVTLRARLFQSTDDDPYARWKNILILLPRLSSITLDEVCVYQYNAFLASFVNVLVARRSFCQELHTIRVSFSTGGGVQDPMHLRQAYCDLWLRLARCRVNLFHIIISGAAGFMRDDPVLTHQCAALAALLSWHTKSELPRLREQGKWSRGDTVGKFELKFA
ncbi:hypothetical protein EIP91_000688 [Steccherinum ochraceum]|uniref:F-box domain-containing protein n=1 Tax=Steccherinum ochraceum TaxID=92696 RepID=A0A4R0RNU3_9APHY|nr:hypothetical protein EIP91_000688 [Steccherinum ochraceum]